MIKSTKLLTALIFYAIPVCTLAGDVYVEVEMALSMPDIIHQNESNWHREGLGYKCEVFDSSGRVLGSGRQKILIGPDGQEFRPRKVRITPDSRLSGQVDMLSRAARYKCQLYGLDADLSPDRILHTVRSDNHKHEYYRATSGSTYRIVTEGAVAW